MSGSVQILNTLGSALFQAAYEISPILMTGGIAEQFGFGSTLPIGALTVPLSVFTSALGGATDALDSFPRFRPLPGGSILNYEAGTYPFANQATAANAVIAQPINISLMMINPVRSAGGYTLKLATYTALHWVFQQHIQSGGTFTVATPAFIYDSCLLLRFFDISGDETKQPQHRWQLDFVRPLITAAEAVQIQKNLNTFMGNVDSGAVNDGTTSGPNVAGPTASTLGSGGANVPAPPLPVPPIPPAASSLPVPPVPPSAGVGPLIRA